MYSKFKIHKITVCSVHRYRCCISRLLILSFGSSYACTCNNKSVAICIAKSVMYCLKFRRRLSQITSHFCDAIHGKIVYCHTTVTLGWFICVGGGGLYFTYKYTTLQYIITQLLHFVLHVCNRLQMLSNVIKGTISSR